MNATVNAILNDRPKHLHLFLIAILFVAVAFRIYGTLSYPTEPTSDAADYHRLATNLVQQHAYVSPEGAPTAWRPPAYPFFLAGLYELIGINVERATIAQSLLGGLTVFVLMLLGSLIIGWRQSLIAGAIAAVYPAFVWLPRLLLSENLSLFLLLLTLVTIILYLRTSRLGWIVAFAVLCGLNSLVRGANLFLPIAAALGILIIRWKSRSLNWSQALAPLLVMAAVFGLTLLPWTIRNYGVFHEVIPVATQDGITLYGSYWPPQRNGKLIWGTLPGTEDPAIVAASQTGDEASASRYLRQVTLTRLRENPGFFFD